MLLLIHSYGGSNHHTVEFMPVKKVEMLTNATKFLN